VDWEQQVTLWLWRSSIVPLAVLCLRLANSGLVSTYPRFFAYVIALTAESTLLILSDRKPGLYQQVYVVTRIVLLPIEIGAVLEIFNRWSDSFKGIGTFGRRLLLVLLVLAGGICVSTVPISSSMRGWVDFAVYAITVSNRAVQAGLAAFLIFMLIFYSKFGGPVTRNLRHHTRAMTAFVVANTLGYFLIASRFNDIGNLVLQMISTGTLVFWIVALDRSGEEPPERPGNPDDWADAENLNRQLIDYADTVKQSRRGGGKKK